MSVLGRSDGVREVLGAGRPIWRLHTNFAGDDDLNHERVGGTDLGNSGGWDFYHLMIMRKAKKRGNPEDEGLNLGD